MHNEHDNFSMIIKNARLQSEFTMEELAEKLGVTERYLYRIENENKKPSYDVLYKLIRVLSISPDLIFYPEKNSEISEIDTLIRTLCNCDQRLLPVVRTTITALIEASNKEE